MKKPVKQTLTVSVDVIILDLLRQYQNDIFEKSRSLAVQDLLLDFFLENGYIDYKTYCNYRSDMFNLKDEGWKWDAKQSFKVHSEI